MTRVFPNLKCTFKKNFWKVRLIYGFEVEHAFYKTRYLYEWESSKNLSWEKVSFVLEGFISFPDIPFHSDNSSCIVPSLLNPIYLHFKGHGYTGIWRKQNWLTRPGLSGIYTNLLPFFCKIVHKKEKNLNELWAVNARRKEIYESHFTTMIFMAS